jgi:hypothetical protein
MSGAWTLASRRVHRCPLIANRLGHHGKSGDAAQHLPATGRRAGLRPAQTHPAQPGPGSGRPRRRRTRGPWHSVSTTEHTPAPSRSRPRMSESFRAARHGRMPRLPQARAPRSPPPSAKWRSVLHRQQALAARRWRSTAVGDCRPISRSGLGRLANSRSMRASLRQPDSNTREATACTKPWSITTRYGARAAASQAQCKCRR